MDVKELNLVRAKIFLPWTRPDIENNKYYYYKIFIISHIILTPQNSASKILAVDNNISLPNKNEL